MASHLIHRLRETRVLENYSFMTALSILSALIGLVIYPFVIRMTGKEAYGTYVYAFTIATFFQVLLDYGFYSPCSKAIVEAREDLIERGRIVSGVLVLKAAIAAVCTLVFVGCLCFVPFMQHNRWLCIMTFIQLIAQSLFPIWYFQGMKKMKWVTYINLSLRLATIPLIFWLVRSPQDISLYALIVMASIVIGTVVSYIYLFADGIRLQSVDAARLRLLMHDSTPFFATDLTGILKSLAIKTIIKHGFGVGEVAVYDLAEKIITIPRYFTQNINTALFPEVVANATNDRVRRILKYERLIGAGFALLIAVLSYPAVLVLGGNAMLDAVYVTIMLSTTIYTWLVVGGYTNFVFIPAGKYYVITLNQVVSLLSCVLFAFGGLCIWRDISMVAAGVMLSGFVEIVFCRLIIEFIIRSRLHNGW